MTGGGLSGPRRSNAFAPKHASTISALKFHANREITAMKTFKSASSSRSDLPAVRIMLPNVDMITAIHCLLIQWLLGIFLVTCHSESFDFFLAMSGTTRIVEAERKCKFDNSFFWKNGGVWPKTWFSHDSGVEEEVYSICAFGQTPRQIAYFRPWVA